MSHLRLLVSLSTLLLVLSGSFVEVKSQSSSGFIDPCRSYSTCGACAADERHQCGFCYTSDSEGICESGSMSGPTIGICAATSSSEGLRNWNWRRCRPLTDSCESRTDCADCIATPFCGYCDSSQTCIDGNSINPFSASTCSSNTYLTQIRDCPSPIIIPTGGGGGPGGGETENDGNLVAPGGGGSRSTNSVSISSSESENSLRAQIAFGCMLGLCIVSVGFFIYFLALRPCLPRPGSKAHITRNSRFGTYCVSRPCQLLAFGLEIVLLLLLLVAVGVDTYSLVKTNSQSLRFGATRILFTDSDGTTRSLSYACSEDGFTAAQRQQCFTAVSGSVLTLCLLLLSLIGTAATILYSALGLFKELEGFHARLWSASGLSASMCMLGIAMWALSTHVMLQSAYSSSATGIRHISVEFALSWILLWPAAILLAVPLFFFMTGVVEYTAVLPGSGTESEANEIRGPRFSEEVENELEQEHGVEVGHLAHSSPSVHTDDEHDSFGAVLPHDSSNGAAYHMAGVGYAAPAEDNPIRLE